MGINYLFLRFRHSGGRGARLLGARRRARQLRRLRARRVEPPLQLGAVRLGALEVRLGLGARLARLAGARRLRHREGRAPQVEAPNAGSILRDCSSAGVSHFCM